MTHTQPLCEDPESLDYAANRSDIKAPDLVYLVIYMAECAVCLYVYQCMFVTVRWHMFDLLVLLLFILGEFAGGIFKDAVIIQTIHASV